VWPFDRPAAVAQFVVRRSCSTAGIDASWRPPRPAHLSQLAVQSGNYSPSAVNGYWQQGRQFRAAGRIGHDQLAQRSTVCLPLNADCTAATSPRTMIVVGRAIFMPTSFTAAPLSIRRWRAMRPPGLGFQQSNRFNVFMCSSRGLES
jgi:hypothetical protein